MWHCAIESNSYVLSLGPMKVDYKHKYHFAHLQSKTIEPRISREWKQKLIMKFSIEKQCTAWRYRVPRWNRNNALWIKKNSYNSTPKRHYYQCYSFIDYCCYFSQYCFFFSPCFYGNDFNRSIDTLWYSLTFFFSIFLLQSVKPLDFEFQLLLLWLLLVDFKF